MSKLVTYFSYSGVTKRRAENLAKENSAETFEIKAKVPYTSADVNWQDKSSRNVIEYNDKSSRPEIETIPDLSSVDEIWIGYPIWWYTHPRYHDKEDPYQKECLDWSKSKYPAGCDDRGECNHRNRQHCHEGYP